MIIDIYNGYSYHNRTDVKTLLTEEESLGLPSRPLLRINSWEELSEIYPNKGLVKLNWYLRCPDLLIKVKNVYDKAFEETAHYDTVQIIRIHARENQNQSPCKISFYGAYPKCLKKEFSVLDGTHVLDENSFPFIQKIVDLAKSCAFVDLNELITDNFQEKIAKLTKNNISPKLYFSFRG